jgi:hypothetical protein
VLEPGPGEVIEATGDPAPGLPGVAAAPPPVGAGVLAPPVVAAVPASLKATAIEVS